MFYWLEHFSTEDPIFIRALLYSNIFDYRMNQFLQNMKDSGDLGKRIEWNNVAKAYVA